MWTFLTWESISTLERQVFDFLGFMWAPILANFFNIIFVIFGCFGAFQCRRTYIVTYALWVVLWLGWNVFVICFYLNVGVLDRDSDILNLGTGSVSWWEVNGSGCKPSYPTNLTIAEDPDPFRPLRPEHVTGCFLDYQYVEVVHAYYGLFQVAGGLGSVSLNHKIVDDDDDLSIKFRSKRNGSSGNRTSLYSIQINPRESNRGESMEYDDNIESHLSAPQLSPRPMTPRRVKRRSVISRGTTATSSLPHCHDKRSSLRYNNARSSLRSSNRRTKLQHQNPVTRLIEQQQQSLADSSTSNDSTRLSMFNPSSTSSQANLLLNTGTPAWKKSTGHTNPMYQQNSVQSLNDDDEEDDVYNNRPSSARSSYSNYHGARSISCYGGAGRSGYYIPGQATGQVPVQNTHRQSFKNRPTSAFLSSGPPAYHVQGIVDSETVI
ncbi:hypothetical protein L9F63_019544 [Diploptera punctata]|uniref:Sodium/potassium-transporting ATPase subunit beta-1-interacting protein n=1 Tax=Diploptera punctata TaxID=6984 RepID=A0AAD7ZVD3_DIPPU|nr:hypothetical protein L9F63_019544 [Diploptera punctata]